MIIRIRRVIYQKAMISDGSRLEATVISGNLPYRILVPDRQLVTLFSFHSDYNNALDFFLNQSIFRPTQK